ncbi:MAG: sigma-70 family RNA polymerase sigma factor [Bauldia sp.]
MERLIPALRRYAVGLAGDPAAADDLVQDCLVLALDRERQYRGPRLAPWVFTILSNLAKSHHRANRRAPPMENLGDTASADAVDPATRSMIIGALQALPADQRQALLLATVEGFSYQEVADIVAVPIGTVMSRIARGRALLAERLEGAAVVPIRRVK